MKLQNRLIALYLALALVILGAGIVLNYDIYDRERLSMRTHLEKTVNQSLGTVASELDGFGSSMRVFSILGIARKLDFSYSKPSDIDYAAYLLIRQIQQQFTMLLNSQTLVESVELFLPRISRVVCADKTYKRVDDALLAQISELRKIPHDISVYRDGLYLVETLPTVDEEEQAMIYAQVSLASIADLLENNVVLYSTTGDESGVCVQLGSGGTALARAGRAAFEWRADATPGWRELDGGSLYTMPLRHPFNEALTLEIFVKDDFFIDNITGRFWLLTAVQLALTVLSLLIFSNLLARHVTKPLRFILESFDGIAHGNLDMQIRTDANDEFIQLYARFNEMVRKLKHSIEHSYQVELVARNAELKQLQTQINPHFLYNGFFHIYRICKMGDCDQSAIFALLMSRYYEYITKAPSDEMETELENEFGHAQIYAQIQKMRFDDRLTIEMEPLPEALRGYRVPRLILQPLMENAIKHAFEGGNGEGVQIRMWAVWQEDGVRVCVEDSGQGVSDEMIDALRARLDAASLSSLNSGLINVHLRLRLSCGQASGVRVSRSALGGLRVELVILERGGEGYAEISGRG